MRYGVNNSESADDALYARIDVQKTYSGGRDSDRQVSRRTFETHGVTAVAECRTGGTELIRRTDRYFRRK